MRGSFDTRARESLLLAHVQFFAPDFRAPEEPPQSRLSDRVGPALAGLLVAALTAHPTMPRSGLRL